MEMSRFDTLHGRYRLRFEKWWEEVQDGSSLHDRDGEVNIVFVTALPEPAAEDDKAEENESEDDEDRCEVHADHCPSSPTTSSESQQAETYSTSAYSPLVSSTPR